MSIAVIKPGLLTTLQDAGRPSLAHLGIGRAGAFDVPAARIANALCGNPRGACALEITLLGPTLRFDADTWIAVTGAPVSFRIAGAQRQMWAPVFTPSGATVTFGAMRTGCRSYFAVRGGFDIEPVLGSRSMDVNARLGPFDGRPLRAGDRLPTQAAAPLANAKAPGWSIDPRPWFACDAALPLRLLPGSHFDALTETSRNALFSEAFIVHADSNRVGLRFTGPKLEWSAPVELVSEGCVPGLLQLPPSGHPIAFGPECPVSGGYPRIGQIAAVDMPRLAQRRPGDALRFTPCTFDEALAALRERERTLQSLEFAVHQRLQQDRGYHSST